MLKKVSAFGLGFALLAASLSAAPAVERKNLQVLNDVSKAVQTYSYFTVFDDVNASIQNGVVTLTGRVTMPFKRGDLEKRVSRIPGVASVNDRLAVLPVSPFDDQLRYRLARVIYGNQNFDRYAMMANPPIHIVVEHGRVTLTGVVNSNLERVLARSLAANQFGVMSITNDLKTDDEVREQLEHIS